VWRGGGGRWRGNSFHSSSESRFKQLVERHLVECHQRKSFKRLFDRYVLSATSLNHLLTPFSRYFNWKHFFLILNFDYPRKAVCSDVQWDSQTKVECRKKSSRSSPALANWARSDQENSLQGKVSRLQLVPAQHEVHWTDRFWRFQTK